MLSVFVLFHLILIQVTGNIEAELIQIFKIY